MKKCQHTNTVQCDDWCFAGPVARDENRAAHGGVTYAETCRYCGASRQVNQNQGHFEFGPWGPDAKTQRERRQALERAAELAADAAQQFHDIELLRLVGVRVWTMQHDRIDVTMDCERKWLPVQLCRDAAEQHDDGDAMAPVYAALLRVAGCD